MKFCIPFQFLLSFSVITSILAQKKSKESKEAKCGKKCKKLFKKNESEKLQCYEACASAYGDESESEFTAIEDMCLFPVYGSSEAIGNGDLGTLERVESVDICEFVCRLIDGCTTFEVNQPSGVQTYDCDFWSDYNGFVSQIRENYVSCNTYTLDPNAINPDESGCTSEEAGALNADAFAACAASAPNVEQCNGCLLAKLAGVRCDKALTDICNGDSFAVCSPYCGTNDECIGKIEKALLCTAGLPYDAEADLYGCVIPADRTCG